MRAARALLPLLSLALVASGGGLLVEPLRLEAKGLVARVLISRALSAHLEDGEEQLPWQYADTAPLALLEVPRLGLRRVVLSGASGSSLAFGPGHVDGTERPNRRGNCAIAGHRDSWFAFLEQLRVGDALYLRTHEISRRYVVFSAEPRMESDGDVLAPSATVVLTLITCYPFDERDQGPWRYVVRCKPG